MVAQPGNGRGRMWNVGGLSWELKSKLLAGGGWKELWNYQMAQTLQMPEALNYRTEIPFLYFLGTLQLPPLPTMGQRRDSGHGGRDSCTFSRRWEAMSQGEQSLCEGHSGRSQMGPGYGDLGGPVLWQRVGPALVPSRGISGCDTGHREMSE